MSSEFWRRMTDSLSFYTWATNEQIPERPGCYAWYLPLHIYDDDPDLFLQRVARLFDYDSLSEGAARSTTSARFNWDVIDLEVTRASHLSLTPEKRSKWVQILSDEGSKSQLRELLLQSSLFMPPLYVGKTQSLRRRYLEHVNGKGGGKNDFNHRFTTFAESEDLPIRIDDLVFACLETAPVEVEGASADELNDILEYLLIRLSRPAFGRM